MIHWNGEYESMSCNEIMRRGGQGFATSRNPSRLPRNSVFELSGLIKPKIGSRLSRVSDLWTPQKDCWQDEKGPHSERNRDQHFISVFGTTTRRVGSISGMAPTRSPPTYKRRGRLKPSPNSPSLTPIMLLSKASLCLFALTSLTQVVTSAVLPPPVKRADSSKVGYLFLHFYDNYESPGVYATYPAGEQVVSWSPFSI